MAGKRWERALFKRQWPVIKGNLTWMNNLMSKTGVCPSNKKPFHDTIRAIKNYQLILRGSNHSNSRLPPSSDSVRVLWTETAQRREGGVWELWTLLQSRLTLGRFYGPYLERFLEIRLAFVCHQRVQCDSLQPTNSRKSTRLLIARKSNILQDKLS